MPFVGFRLVGDDHVPVTHCSFLFGEVLEVGKGGEVVLGCLDDVGIEICGDVEIRFCVDGKRCVVVRFGPLAFKSYGSACGGEGD